MIVSCTPHFPSAVSASVLRKVVTSLLPCRKHHCQVHHVGTNTLVLDPKLQQKYDPKSDYKATFHPRPFQPLVRRGMAPPARILPEAPGFQMEHTTVTHRDFVPKPLASNQRCKERNNLKMPRGSFQDLTSYKNDFPLRELESNQSPPQMLLGPSLPKIIRGDPGQSFLTTSKDHLRDWGEGDHRSTPYKELQEDRFFEGAVQRESVSKVDFSEVAVDGGKPSTSCKVVATRKPPEGEFDGKTTNGTIYKLPVIDKREPPRLKGRSETHRETLLPVREKMSLVTQYQRDHPHGYHTSKRWLCPPHPDRLQLFEGTLRGLSEQKSSYRTTTTTMPGMALPRESFKVNGLATYPIEGGRFRGETTTNSYYQRVPSKERFAEAQAVNDKAIEVSKLTPLNVIERVTKALVFSPLRAPLDSAISFDYDIALVFWQISDFRMHLVIEQNHTVKW